MSADLTELGANMRDKLWRLRNLYSCREEGTGRKLKLVLRPEQEMIFQHLIATPHIPLYIIKSRRLGISTGIDTFAADEAAFRTGFRGLIIDQTQADATKKMVEIVRFALDSLPPSILTRFVFDKRNDSELRMRWPGEVEAQDSVIYATTGGRGGDCSMLHVSEWGPIAALDPARSNEIRTGAFPSARKGIRVVETTWMGGKHGELWELIKPVLEHNPAAEGVFMFFPWHADPQAVRFDGGEVTNDIAAYFDEIEGRLGKKFSREQKKWYAAKVLEQGIYVKREYPSTEDEAFSAPMAGAIYAKQVDEARAAGRIRPFEWDRGAPVFSAWDLGWGDSTAIWLLQLIGRDVHWIWYCEQTHRTAAEMVTLLNATGIPVGLHLLPHDAAAKSAAEGKSYEDALVKAGLVNIKIVPRCTRIGPGIDALRNLLSRSWFRLPACTVGVEMLEAYHMKDTQAGGVVVQEPVHDYSSHGASAARIFAEALELGMVDTQSARRIIRAPRAPDGTMVELDYVQQRREAQQSALATSYDPLAG